MIPLFAHHIEMFHVPVLLVLFTAGAWIGWQMIGGMLNRNNR
jgi:hypothetical protein